MVSREPVTKQVVTYVGAIRKSRLFIMNCKIFGNSACIFICSNYKSVTPFISELLFFLGFLDTRDNLNSYTRRSGTDGEKYRRQRNSCKKQIVMCDGTKMSNA